MTGASLRSALARHHTACSIEHSLPPRLADPLVGRFVQCSLRARGQWLRRRRCSGREEIGHTEKQGGSGIGAIKAKRAFEPRQGVRGSTGSHRNVAPHYIALGIARIDPEGAPGLGEGKVDMSPVQMDQGERAVSGGRSRVPRQGFLRQCFGAAESVGNKFRPSRSHLSIIDKPSAA